MKKISRFFLMSLVLFSLCLNCYPLIKTQAAKKGYITNKNFQGTFSLNGREGTLEYGGYEITIGSISKAGKAKFKIDRWSANANSLSSVSPMSAKIKGNTITFLYEDADQGHKGRGTMVFNKNKTIYLTMKTIKNPEWPTFISLEIKKSLFKKTSKKHNL